MDHPVHVHTFTHALTSDLGAVFSGADLVRWMVWNVAGVDGEEDAERLGQMLVDKGVVFHTEGSS